jgi:hypothetical protein
VLVADPGEASGIRETEAAVQFDRGRISRVGDHRDDLADSRIAAGIEQVAQEFGPAALPDGRWCDVDGVLDGRPAGGTRLPGRAVGVSGDVAVALGDEERQARVGDRGEPAATEWR